MSARQAWDPSDPWPITAAVGGMAACWMLAAGLTVEWSALVRITMAVLVLQAVAWFYTARRPNLNIVATVRGLSQLLVAAVLAIPLPVICQRNCFNRWFVLPVYRGIGAVPTGLVLVNVVT